MDSIKNTIYLNTSVSDRPKSFLYQRNNFDKRISAFSSIMSTSALQKDVVAIFKAFSRFVDEYIAICGEERAPQLSAK